MGLSTQGKNIHDVIASRQDSEIRLIEVMRKCLLLKVKCDRDYACSIQNVSLVGMKIDRIDDLNGNLKKKTFKTGRKRKKTNTKAFSSESVISFLRLWKYKSVDC